MISTKGRYSLRILLDLAHSLENGGPMYYANPLGQ